MTIAVILLSLVVIVLVVKLKIRAERQARLDRAIAEHVKRKIKIGGTD